MELRDIKQPRGKKSKMKVEDKGMEERKGKQVIIMYLKEGCR